MYLFNQIAIFHLLFQLSQSVYVSGNFFPSQVIQDKILATSLTASRHSCTFKGIDWMDCILRCRKDDNCVSYNFKFTLETCELNAFGLLDKCNEKRLVYSEKGVFQQIREDKNQPKCMSSLTCGQSIHQVGQDSCQVRQVRRSSCNDIIQNEESRGNGEYTINPVGLGELRVYCDMTTEGGGWTLLKKATAPIPQGSTRLDSDVNVILKSYNDPHLLIMPSGLKNVREALGFKQMRYFCTKKTGKRVHIMTSNDASGHDVIRYFSETTTPAKACGSFIKLTDDTSGLSDNCKEWGLNIGDDVWGNSAYIGEQRVQRKVIFWNKYPALHIFSMIPGEYLCDDDKGALTDGDTWSLFVR